MALLPVDESTSREAAEAKPGRGRVPLDIEQGTAAQPEEVSSLWASWTSWAYQIALGKRFLACAVATTLVLLFIGLFCLLHPGEDQKEKLCHDLYALDFHHVVSENGEDLCCRGSSTADSRRLMFSRSKPDPRFCKLMDAQLAQKKRDLKSQGKDIENKENEEKKKGEEKQDPRFKAQPQLFDFKAQKSDFFKNIKKDNKDEQVNQFKKFDSKEVFFQKDQEDNKKLIGQKSLKNEISAEVQMQRMQPQALHEMVINDLTKRTDAAYNKLWKIEADQANKGLKGRIDAAKEKLASIEVDIAEAEKNTKENTQAEVMKVSKVMPIDAAEEKLAEAEAEIDDLIAAAEAEKAKSKLVDREEQNADLWNMDTDLKRKTSVMTAASHTIQQGSAD